MLEQIKDMELDSIIFSFLLKTYEYWPIPGLASNIIYIISIVITLAVAFLILGPRPSGISSYTVDVSILPFINASLNFLTSKYTLPLKLPKGL